MRLVRRHHQRGILVDTNILLMWFVGNYRKSLIPSFKRTAAFAPEDHDLLLGLLSLFVRTVTTPSILAEVNSLSGQLGGNRRAEYFERFAAGIGTLKESYVPAKQLADLESFRPLGLTDTAIVRGARGGYLVLTVDFALAGFLQSRKLGCINFNHIRAFGWTA